MEDPLLKSDRMDPDLDCSSHLLLLYYNRGMKPFLLRLASLPLSWRILTVSSIMTELITSITLYVRVITMLLSFLAFKPLSLLELGS